MNSLEQLHVLILVSN